MKKKPINDPFQKKKANENSKTVHNSICNNLQKNIESAIKCKWI